MKRCLVEVSIDDGNQVQKQNFGNRWKNGMTTLILKPMLPWFMGAWDSDRQIDIDSAAGSDHAFYIRQSGNLYVKTGGYETFGTSTTDLKLNEFEMKVGGGGDGVFFFRNLEWEIYCQVIRFAKKLCEM